MHRTYLLVLAGREVLARSLGARWDAGHCCRYVMDRKSPPGRFSQWLRRALFSSGRRGEAAPRGAEVSARVS
jgi:hypothetical protein